MGTHAGGGRYYTSQHAQSLPTGAPAMQDGPSATGSNAQAGLSPAIADMPPAAPWPAPLNVASRAFDSFYPAGPASQSTSVAAVYDAAPSQTSRSRAKSLGAHAAANARTADQSRAEKPPTSKRASTRRRPVPDKRHDSAVLDRPMSYPSESIDPVMESFSIRSPLQELEDKFTTKELKRQRLLEAERRANQRKLKRQSRNVDPTYLESIESFELPLQGLQPRRMSTTEEQAENGPPVRRSRSGKDCDREKHDGSTNGYAHPDPVNETHEKDPAPVAADQFYIDSPIHPRQDRERAAQKESRPSAQVQAHSHSDEKATDVLAIKQQRKRSPRSIELDSASDTDSQHDSDPEAQLDLGTPLRKLKHTSTADDGTRRPGYFSRLKSAILNQPTDTAAIQEARRNELGFAYRVPPKTAAGQQEKAQAAFTESKPADVRDASEDARARFSGILGATSQDGLEPALPPPPPLEEWRRQNVGRLILDDFALNAAIVGSRSNSKRHRGLDGASDDRPTTFSPPLFLKCGPLLRYTGMRRERRARPGQTTITEREVWRGTIMIVTEDDKSSYQQAPSLRLFAQSQDPIPGADPTDLIAGRKTTSRTGRTLYIKPADQLPPHEDLSKIENGRGLFDTKRYGEHAQESSPRRGVDGEKAGKVRHVNAVRLHKERGLTFWRFQIEVELGTKQARVAYRINNGPVIGFWVPGRNQAMNIMFHSCNGFSMSVDPKPFSGPDPLWRDVLNTHEKTPYHVMIGGGDQVYNDAIVRDTQLFRDWMNTKNPERKHKAMFSRQMQDELEESYLQRYSTWYSQGLFKVANSQIPMVNMWDDHDIIDGFGSYPHHLMASRVFSGLGTVAFKYYMLFQHQSVVSETYEHEPSWQLGIAPGPYINQLSRSLFMFLGRKIALLAVDCRTERMRDEIMTRESYELILNRCRSEIVRGETKHLLVLLGVPIAYPRLNFLENILTSKAMDPIKALGRTGVLGGFVNKFDGGIEILDNLDDHWTAKHHKKERKWFVQELQELAAEKSVRITILGGDVHLAAVGQFHTSKAQGVPKDLDHRYMLNIVSSAIVNEPPPVMLADVLAKRNKVHHLDGNTEESMCEVFTRDVDGRPRNNVSLLPHRNYCTITEYQPDSLPERPSRGRERQVETEAVTDVPIRRYPPGSMGQSGPPIASLRPRNLIRRMSGSRERESGGLKPKHIRAYSDSQSGEKPRFTKDRQSTDQSGYDDGPDSDEGYDENVFDDDEPNEPNFDGGLEITLNVEADQGAVAGTTKSYGILVPALFYDDPNEHHAMPGRARRPSIIDRLKGVAARRSRSRSTHSDGSRTPSDRSESPPPEPKVFSKQPETFDGAGPHDPSPHVHFDAILGQQKPPVDNRRDSQQTPSTPTPPPDASHTEPRRSNSSAKRPAIPPTPASDPQDPPPQNKRHSNTGLLSYIRQKREQNRDKILRYESHRAARLDREKDRKGFSHSVPGLSTRFDASGRPHAPARINTQMQGPHTRVTYDEGEESPTPSDTETAGVFTPGEVGSGWTHGQTPWGPRR